MATQFIFIDMEARIERGKRAKPALLAALAVAGLSLSACADSVGLENAPKVASVSDLDSCAAGNAGEAVFVEDERMLYVCGEEGWKAELEPAEYEQNCGAAVVSNDSVSKCGEDGTFRDSRDGRVYKCVKIGDQTWMAENLDFGEIVHSSGNQVKASTAHAQKYCYNNDSTNCAKYGGLYQWHTAMGLCAEYAAMDASALVGNPPRGICPAGWHVPTQDEWEKLVEFVPSPDSNTVGRELKSKTEWSERQFCTNKIENWYGTMCQGYVAGANGKDLYGWNALPGGFFGNVRRPRPPGQCFIVCPPGHRDYDDEAEFLDDADEFWTATESGSKTAVKYSIFPLGDSMRGGTADKAFHSARSVRCVQD